jgi:NAD(P)-dependent dehydrogenase (short-subunit alcohol dehydrogenase family)
VEAGYFRLAKINRPNLFAPCISAKRPKIKHCVAPGATATEQWLKGKSEELLQTIANLSPLSRLGTPGDMAGLVAFFVSPQGEWVNGQVIRVNGGFA